jgi:hypothetical protein
MIAGAGADARRVDAARRVAEAEIDILRVRDARAAVQRASIGDQYRYSTAETRRRLQRMLSSRKKTRDIILADAILRLVDPIPPSEIGETEQFCIRVDEAARELSRLDRYERRAMSRRRSALRELDDLGARNESP